MATKLYYSELNKHYFTVDDKINCKCCEQIINKIMVNVVEWSKKRSQEYNLCFNCINNKIFSGIVTEKRIVLIVDCLPDDAIPIIMATKSKRIFQRRLLR